MALFPVNCNGSDSSEMSVNLLVCKAECRRIKLKWYYLNVSLSLMLGLYLNPVSKVCRRPTLCIAVETGEPMLLSSTYLLPVSGVDTLRADDWKTNTHFNYNMK